MRIGIGIGTGLDPLSLDEIISNVRDAAAAGLASAWLGQFFAWDPLIALSVAGREAPGIALGTAVIQTYPIHPQVLASQALSAQAATGNRLTLGIGPSHRMITEGMLGYPFDRPARHTREYLEILGPLLRGESVSYQGEFLKAEGTVTVPGAEAPALLVAALGPVMLRLAGELADGTVTAWAGPATLANHIVPTLTQAAASAGRPSPRVVAGVLLRVTSDAAAAREQAGERYAMSGQMPSYRALLDREGVANPEDLLVAGDERAVERELRRYIDAGATEIVAFAEGPRDDRARSIALLSDLARAERAVAV
jgi:F420-dependent oxidoreductase-like protein